MDIVADGAHFVMAHLCSAQPDSCMRIVRKGFRIKILALPLLCGLQQTVQPLKLCPYLVVKRTAHPCQVGTSATHVYTEGHQFLSFLWLGPCLIVSTHFLKREFRYFMNFPASVLLSGTDGPVTIGICDGLH